MPGFDSRRVLAALYEKGWLAYEDYGDCHEPVAKRLTGPVDNILPEVTYRLMPVTVDPADIPQVCSLTDRSNAKVALFFDSLEGARTQIAGFYIKDGKVTFVPFSHLTFPVDELEEKIRKHVSEFRFR